jgi:hypothetical protein
MKKVLSYVLFFSLLTPMICLAVSAPPGGNGGSSSPTYAGATTISDSNTYSKQSYSSATGSQNALLVSGGTSTLDTCTVTKTGDSSDENADFYGTNAGVLVYNGATLNINEGTVTTNGSHANGVFAYGSGKINLTKTVINTTSNNSGGIMVTGGGTLNATDLTVTTAGNSSASIRSDRGGGTLTVSGGTYKTTGVGSPAIYSTANITVNNANLTATASEGTIIEGANSITLNSTTLEDTNTTLNGNSETYKNIFLYQSMSGDASTGTATFTAKDSNIITNKGDSIFVTNTTATVNLENNTFTNSDGDFLRIQKGKWGNSGSNGGNVTLNLTNQQVTGNIIVDNISTLQMNLTSGSIFNGSIDHSNTASKINLNLSSDSVLILTNDSYADSLTNANNNNTNIYLNGHSLTVNGKKISGNTGTYDGTIATDDTTTETTTATSNNKQMLMIGFIIIAILIALIVFILIKRKSNK